MDEQSIILACVLLATKMEETVRKTRDILACGLYVLKGIHTPEQKVAKIHFIKKALEMEKQLLMEAEQAILTIIQFEFDLVHPYEFIVKFAKKFKFTKEIAKRAWNMTHTLYRCPISIQYPAHALAMSTLLLCQGLYGESLELDKQMLERVFLSPIPLGKLIQEIIKVYKEIFPDKPYEKAMAWIESILKQEKQEEIKVKIFQ
jgi:hypothetical protein